MANKIDKIVSGIAKTSCKIWENQPLCKAARNHQKKEAIVERQERDRERISVRQEELATIKRRAEAMERMFQANPEAVLQYYKKIVGSRFNEESFLRRLRSPLIIFRESLKKSTIK